MEDKNAINHAVCHFDSLWGDRVGASFFIYANTLFVDNDVEMTLPFNFKKTFVFKLLTLLS